MSSFYSTRLLIHYNPLYKDFSGSLATAAAVRRRFAANGITFLLPPNFKTTLAAYDKDY